jgi:hypothetical protein
LPIVLHAAKKRPGPCVGRRRTATRVVSFRAGLFLALALAVAGCGGGSSANNNSGTGTGGFKISPGTATIDTNCTGCTDSSGNSSSYQQFSATMNGAAANVTWKVTGGDASQGPGSIGSSNGQYTPPAYLTADSVKVTVTATLASSNTTATATLTVTPGFLQPLSPENFAAGSGNAPTTITGYIAEVGGSTQIKYSLAGSYNGSNGGQGSLGQSHCNISSSGSAYTSCTVMYTPPAAVSATSATYIVGTVGSSSSKVSTEVLLNSAGVNSSPVSHEMQQGVPVELGSSGGNKNDYDSSQGQIQDCCGGTLGSLVKDSSGNFYILSNNHVLARSDQASKGEDIVQPGLVDDNCDPSKGTLVGTLTGWLPLSSTSTNADAALAQVNSGAVDTSGAILELGARQSDGTLAAAPPGTSCTIASSVSGVSCTPGKGETPAIGMTVAKSGRTTGLTCASVTAVNLSVQVDYYKDCAETQSYTTKTYQNQVEITGDQFTDAGDSGSLIVNTSNAEPVGLFFAGGVDSSGSSESVASPAPDVLNELDSQLGGTYTYVGGADHPVSCLNYGAGTVAAAQNRTLTGPQTAQAENALTPARQLVNPRQGILGVATGKSSDEPGTPAVVVYVSPNAAAQVPATIHGVRTVVVPTTSSAVATGSAPLANLDAESLPSLPAAALTHAIAVKQSIAANLMKQNPAFFGVGVGQSYDDPAQPALVIFVDRNRVPSTLPTTIGGLRTRYVIMTRLHVTRAYLSPVPTHSRCMLQSVQPDTASGLNLQNLLAPRPLPLK